MGQYLGSSGDVISHLNISSLHSSDGGLYQCSAANTVGRASHQANINIYGQYTVQSCLPSPPLLYQKYSGESKTSSQDFNGFLSEKTQQVF